MISTIIVTYNGSEFINKCIDSLLNSTYKCKIIVIDNFSNDNTRQILKKYKDRISIICNKENLGFGKGNNIGIRKAISMQSDYLFLLNQDAWVKPDTIELLIDAHKLYPDYGIISPCQLNTYDVNVPGDQIEFFFRMYIPRELTSDLILNKKLKKLYPVSLLDATAWFIPNDTIKKVGGFDPLFTHYGEDYNYCHRVLSKGIKLGLCPDSFVFHDRERQGRSHNNKYQVATVQYLMRLLHPENNFNKECSAYIKKHYKELVKSFFYLNKNNVSFHRRMLHFLKNVNKKNSNRTLSRYYTFLDIDH